MTRGRCFTAATVDAPIFSRSRIRPLPSFAPDGRRNHRQPTIARWGRPTHSCSFARAVFPWGLRSAIVTRDNAGRPAQAVCEQPSQGGTERDTGSSHQVRFFAAKIQTIVDGDRRKQYADGDIFFYQPLLPRIVPFVGNFLVLWWGYCREPEIRRFPIPAVPTGIRL